jgi:hypothetical protein
MVEVSIFWAMFITWLCHFSGVVIKQTRPGPIHRTLSPTLDISVLGGNQVSDPACTLNKNIPDVTDPVHEHLIKDGL